MDVSEIITPGDTPGTEWRLPVLRFTGHNPKAPKTYIQAALHAGELPGTVLLHFLCERLRQAENQGEIAGDITIVPQANPIGAAQSHFGELQGRFDLGSRTNFNRDFPLISIVDRATLIEGLDNYPATDRLKRQLLHMALGADLVLDLHCDDESLQYAYIDEAFWPEAADLAAALDMEAVLLSDGESSAFEEAVGFAWKYEVPGERRPGCPANSPSPSSCAANATSIRCWRKVMRTGSGTSLRHAGSLAMGSPRQRYFPVRPCHSTMSRSSVRRKAEPCSSIAISARGLPKATAW